MNDRNGTFRHWLRRKTFLSLPAIAAVALLAIPLLAVGVLAGAFVLLGPSGAAYADHNSLYAICPDPVTEGNSSQMGIRRSGYNVESAYIFTDHQGYTADSSDYEEYHGIKIESGQGENTLWAPIVTKEDTLPEHDETFAIGFWDGGVWHHCVVTIDDDDAPEILNVNISSAPVDGHAYRAGDSIDVAVDLDSKAEVEGTPLLSLFIGDGDDSVWRGAEYHSGSGTRSLVFRYEVQPEDFDSDGISVGSAASNDDGSPASGFSGNIYAEGTDVPINHSHAGLQGSWQQQVDGRPYVQDARIISSPQDGWTAYRANQVIEIALTFDTDVVVEGEVSMELYLEYTGTQLAQDTRLASYIRGSGTDTLVFGYTVRPGDMAPEGVGLTLGTESTGFSGDGAIKAKGTDVERNPYYLGTGYQPDHKVDTEPPAVSSVSITSQPANGEAYGAGETISVEVAFGENVTSTGDTHLELDVGGVAHQATLQAVSQGSYSDSLVFHYQVQEGDTDSDGIGIGANRLSVDDGGIYDNAGNAANLSHGAVVSDSNQKVAASQE